MWLTVLMRGLFFMLWRREERVGRRTRTQFMLSTGPEPYAHFFHPCLSVTSTPMSNRRRLRMRYTVNHIREGAQVKQN